MFGCFAVIGLAGYLAYRAHLRQILPPLESLTVEQKHALSREAFSNTGSPADPDAQAISSLLDQLNLSLKEHSSAKLIAAFDGQRFAQEVDRMNAFGGNASASKEATIPVLAKNGAEWVLGPLKSHGWTSQKVKKIYLSENHQEALVYNIEFADGSDHEMMKMRWWLRRDGSHWRVFDRETMNLGYRSSTFKAATIQAWADSSVTGYSQSNVNQAFAAYNTATTQGDFKAADVALHSMDSMFLPDCYKQSRYVDWIWLHYREGMYTACLTDCDAIEKLGADVPMIQYYRTLCYFNLRKYDESLASAKKLEECLGDDREVYYEMGKALARLNRKDEAAAAFGKSLDQDADANNSLAELSRLLPAEKKDEIVTRFNQSHHPARVFQNTMETLSNSRDTRGMELLLEAYRGHSESANDPWLAYYAAQLKIDQKQFADAEHLLEPLLPQAGTKQTARFRRRYFYAAVQADDTVHAYEVATDKQEAFTTMASQLRWKKEKADELGRLLDAHLKDMPDDPWGYYYLGLVKTTSGDLEAADAAYARAMSLAEKDDLDTFLSARVDARYEAGKGLLAYAQISPKKDVFEQLARRYAADKKPADLAALLAARRGDAADDLLLPLWDANICVLKQEDAAAVDLLEKCKAVVLADASMQYRWRDLYVRSQVRLKHFSEARQVAGAAKYKDWMQVAMIECAAGNVPEGINALNKYLAEDEDNDVEDLYADPDIGPALAADGYADWRKAHPRPTSEPATEPTTEPS